MHDDDRDEYEPEPESPRPLPRESSLADHTGHFPGEDEGQDECGDDDEDGG